MQERIARCGDFIPWRTTFIDARAPDSDNKEIFTIIGGGVPRHEILMITHRRWRLNWQGGSVVLNPDDTCAVPPNLSHSIEPGMSSEASLYRVRNDEHKAGPTGALL